VTVLCWKCEENAPMCLCSLGTVTPPALGPGMLHLALCVARFRVLVVNGVISTSTCAVHPNGHFLGGLKLFELE